jgi:Spy/CpxP family protein refolding chaperone
MRKLSATLLAAAAILTMSALAWKADAQTSRGATIPPVQEQNFSPVKQTACGPFWGGHCGPWHHWVCGPYGHRCWCARC